jgi:hypothetical protein
MSDGVDVPTKPASLSFPRSIKESGLASGAQSTAFTGELNGKSVIDICACITTGAMECRFLTDLKGLEECL